MKIRVYGLGALHMEKGRHRRAGKRPLVFKNAERAGSRISFQAFVGKVPKYCITFHMTSGAGIDEFTNSMYTECLKKLDDKNSCQKAMKGTLEGTLLCMRY